MRQFAFMMFVSVCFCSSAHSVDRASDSMDVAPPDGADGVRGSLSPGTWTSSATASNTTAWNMNASNGSNLTASADSAPMRPVRRHGSSEDLGVGRNKTMHGTRTASDPEGATAALAGVPGPVFGERPYTRRHSSPLLPSDTFFAWVGTTAKG